MRSNHLSKMRARQAAKDYMHGADLRAQSEELSDKLLGVKFGCSSFTIRKVREHMPVVALDDEDQVLIRQCAAEKARIDQQLPKLTKSYLSRHYQVSPEAIDIELDLVGWEDPRIQRKKRRAA